MGADDATHPCMFVVAPPSRCFLVSLSKKSLSPSLIMVVEMLFVSFRFELRRREPRVYQVQSATLRPRGLSEAGVSRVGVQQQSVSHTDSALKNSAVCSVAAGS